MVMYVPGTEEKDPKKVIMSLQQIGPATSTNTTNITTNTADIATNTTNIAANTSAIATLNAATYVNSIAGNSGAFTLGAGIMNSTNLIKLSLLNATLQASPSNPTGTTSTTGLMMGIGGTFKLTPVYSSRVQITLQGAGAVTIATASFATQLRFGTGSAPANAAALTGTTVGNSLTGWSAVANALTPFCMIAIITGLTPGTAYWFDTSLAVSTGTGTLTGLSCTAMEF